MHVPEESTRKLVIFDLDDTLVHEGFEDEKGFGENMLFKDVKGILQYLTEKGHVLAVASHNEKAESVLQTCNIHQYFKVIVGYCPRSFEKTPLVEDVLNRVESMGRDDVIFFDDLSENVAELKRKGIRAKLVSWVHGVTFKDLQEMGL